MVSSQTFWVVGNLKKKCRYIELVYLVKSEFIS